MKIGVRTADESRNVRDTTTMETSKHETLTVKGLDFVKIRRDGEVIDTISVKDDPE